MTNGFNFDSILHHPIFQQVVTWILFGLIAGVVAKVILPGPENMGWVRTILVGIAGSFVGGFIGRYFGLGVASLAWSLPAFLTAVGGALVLLIINRVVTRS